MRMVVSLSLMGEGKPEVKKGASHWEPPSLHLEDGRSALLTPVGVKMLMLWKLVWVRIGPDYYTVQRLGGNRGSKA